MLLTALALTLATTVADTLPCNVPVDRPSAEVWHLKRGNGFTFCVPADWTPVGKPGKAWDQPSWRFGTSAIRWQVGMPPSNDKIVEVGGRAVTRSPSGSFTMAPLGQSPATISEEEIGGHTVSLWDRQMGAKRETRAVWREAGFYFVGDTTDPRIAQLQWSVYRTVRVTAP